jgi:putative tricarboxylic transport membrane protein
MFEIARFVASSNPPTYAPVKGNCGRAAVADRGRMDMIDSNSVDAEGHARRPQNPVREAPMNRLILAAGAGALVAAMTMTTPAAAQIQGLEILVPAAPGGGWDQTGRAMQNALQEENLASGIQVVNIPGAGGTIGLAQFVSSKEGQGNALMTGGLVMLGAILTNQSPVTLEQVTPIARLTGEYEVIVVPASSELRTLDDLIAQFKQEPQSVSWGGGSAGGTDHMLVGLIAKATGVDPAGINYVPFSGGGEALASILGGHVTAGVSGYQEFAGQIETGNLRALAISSAERLEGIDIPTLKEQGVDVELTNWRAVFAPPGISDADKQALTDAVAKMVESKAWQSTLKDRAWLNLYLPPDEFARFLQQDSQQVATVLKDIGLVQE